MDAVNMTELLDAGVGFDIREADRPFLENGELMGLREVRRRGDFDVAAELHAAREVIEANEALDEVPRYDVGETYAEALDAATELLAKLDGADGDHGSMYFTSSEGLVDTEELCRPYWDEVADAHVAEQRDARWRTTPRRGDVGQPTFGTMEYFAAQRERRFTRLVRLAKRLRRAGRMEKLGGLRWLLSVRQEYFRKATVLSGREVPAPNWALYLTQAQLAYFERL